jgi:hypothetical protein
MFRDKILAFEMNRHLRMVLDEGNEPFDVVDSTFDSMGDFHPHVGETALTINESREAILDDHRQELCKLVEGNIDSVPLEVEWQILAAHDSTASENGCCYGPRQYRIKHVPVNLVTELCKKLSVYPIALLPPKAFDTYRLEGL